MCFILHMASKSPAPLVPWNEAAKGVWTETAKESDLAELRPKLTLNHITHVGSSNHCGCNLRHAEFQQGGWFDEVIVTEPDYDPSPEAADHAALVALLEKEFPNDDVVEFYGAWGGLWNTRIEGRLTISAKQIIDRVFHFRDQVLYTVRLNNERLAA
jgi:hypothetical protein